MSDKERSIAFLDIDNTIIDGFIGAQVMQVTIDEGLVSPEKATPFFITLERYKARQLEYETFAKILLDQWAAALKGTQYSRVVEVANKVSYSAVFRPFSEELIATLSASHDTYLVTGEPDFVAETIRSKFRAIGHISSSFAVNSGRFSGEVRKYLAHRGDKLAEIDALLKKYELNSSIAFGDSEADIEMLSAVTHRVCLGPSLGLRNHALSQNWCVLEADSEEVIARVKELIGRS